MNIRLLCCSGSLDGGGSERQLWQLATKIDRSRFSPEFYLHYRRGKYLECLPPDMPVHDFWSSNASTWPNLPASIHRRQVHHLSTYLSQAHIDLVYDRTYHMTLVTGPACRASRCPRVSVIVSPPSQDFVRSRERFSIFKKWLLRRAYSAPSARTIAVSDSVAEDASRFYGIDQAAIEVVKSPVDVDSLLRAAKESVPGIDDAPRRLCVVGRMSHEKGQRLAIEAFDLAAKLLGDLEIVLDLVGDGPERPGLEAFAQRLPAGARINFHGFQHNPYPIIAAADALLIPSDYEGLPNVALEAMSLHAGVIATACSDSLRQLLGDGLRGQVVPRRQPPALADAIVARFSEPDLWTSRIDKAYAYVVQHHGLKPWLSRMEQLFADEVLRSRQSGSTFHHKE